MKSLARKEKARAARCKEGSRERILGAAARAFAEAGFDGARVDEIARLAGVNKAMLYYHVGNKAKLHEAVLMRWMDELFAEIGRAIAPGMSPEDKIPALASALESLAKKRPHYPQILLRELAAGGRQLPRSVLARMASLIEFEGTILEDGRRLGRFRPCNPITLHVLLVSGTVMHLMAASLGERARRAGIAGIPRPPANSSRLITEILLNGLKETPK